MIEQQLTGRALLALEKIPAVTALFTVSGEYDMVAAESTGKLNQLLDDIAALPGVVRTNFSVILATKLRRWIYFQSWNDYLLQDGRTDKTKKAVGGSENRHRQSCLLAGTGTPGTSGQRL